MCRERSEVKTVYMQCAVEVGYKKDLRNNYMIIEKSTNKEYAPFCIKMLERQEIEGLLSVEQKLIDNKTLLYYDITAKQSINNILEKSTLSIKGLKSLCSGVIQAIEKAYEYLLSEDDFILAPDFIYQDITSGTPFICLFPGYCINIKDQMSGLMEFLMNKVDYNDKEAVYLVYRLYAVSKEEGYTFEHLKEVLLNKEKNMLETRKDITSVNISDSHSRINTRLDTHIGEHIEKPAAIKNVKEEQIPQNRVIGNIKESNIHVVMEKVEGETEITCYSLVTYLIAGGCLLAGIVILVMSVISKIIFNSIGTRIDYSKLAALFIIIGCVEGYLMSKLFDKKNRITKIVKTKEYIDPRSDYNSYSSYKPTSKNQIIKKVTGQSRLTERSYDNSFTSPVKNTRESKSIDTCLDTYSPASESSCKEISTSTYESTYESTYANTHENVQTTVNRHESNYKDNDEIEVSSPTCLLNASVDKDCMPVLKAMDKVKYKDIPVTSYPFFIGKLKKNVDYCLESDTVSRYHAKITKEGEEIYLTDLNSTNGTFINDEPLQTYQKKEIRYGDVIAFANIKYQLLQE